MNTQQRIAMSMVLLGICGIAEAAMPVIDVAAVRSLAQQVSAWHDQLKAMQLQLAQLQQTHAALTGRRGMERLLPVPVTARNYLPENWSGLASAARGAAASRSGLAGDVTAQVDANSVLSPSDLSRLPPQLVAQLQQNRHWIALEQAVAREAYERSSGRFSQLDTLLNGIATAADEKAIADLHGRIGVEQAMLDNEQIKLAALSQIAVADRNVREQQTREAVIANHGSFATRFQPAMPVP